VLTLPPLEEPAPVEALPLPPPPPRDPVWSGPDVVVLALVAFFTLILCSIVIGFYVAAYHPKQKPEEIATLPVVAILAQVVVSAALFGAMYRMVARRYGRPFWEALRWKWPDGGWALFWCTTGVAIALLVQFASTLAPIPKSLPIYKMFGTTASAYTLAAYGILIAPLIEELFFRGFLFPVLVRRSGVFTAVLLTSLAFMLIHASQLGGAWAPLLILLFVGTVLTVARAWSGSVAASYLIHVGYNLTLFAGLFFSTGYFLHMDRAKP
jgi:membrane protease YdiL (CAAX protease family)